MCWQIKLLLGVPSSWISVAVGDDIAFPIPMADAVGTEILITKNSTAGRDRYLYQVPIAYVSKPKEDKRNQRFVSAEVSHGSLGIGTVFLPCEVLRDYFYRLPRAADTHRPSHPVRGLAYPMPALRHLNFAWLSSCAIWSSNRRARRTQNEWRWSGHSTSSASPNCALAMTRCWPIAEAPAIFPYGGFGSLLVAGEPSRDGQDFLCPPHPRVFTRSPAPAVPCATAEM